MKTFDKICIILACISTALVLWHVFAPRYMWIEGFYGLPLMICMFLMGYGIVWGNDE